MDVSNLLDKFGPAMPEDLRRKVAAINYAHEASGSNVDLETFERRIPSVLKNFKFGNSADDFYFTSLMSTITAVEQSLDTFLAAVLNKLALQLEFQTRYLGKGLAEVFMLEGAPVYLLTAMANVNTAVGLVVGPEHIEVPIWGRNNAQIEFNPLHLHATQHGTAPKVVPTMGRSIGCLSVILHDFESSFNLAERYSFIEPFVTPYTTYLIAGSAGNIDLMREDALKKYPHAAIKTKNYEYSADGCFFERSVLIIDSVNEVPKIWANVKTMLECRFIEVRKCADHCFNTIDYRPSDYIVPKQPMKIITAAPLTEENITKMTATREFFYNVVSIKSGILVPLTSEVDSTYIHLSQKGDIALDAGNEHSRTMMMPLYKNGRDVGGTRHSTLSLGETARVSGAAMPIAFTPDVHMFFSHFMLQCLPRIEILCEIGRLDAKILVPYNIRSKQVAMLRLGGVAEEKVIRIPKNTPVEADELIVPRAWPLLFSPFTVTIYEDMLARVIKNPRKPTRKILISRESRRTWRNMVTYDAVRRILVNKHGFEEIRPELLSIEEEIELYYDTKILIGAEGAGLYSACYMQPDSTVISLCDEDYMMPILGSLAAVRGFNICHVFGESFRSDLDVARRLPYGHADFSMDPCDVEDMLSFVLDA